MSVSTHRSDRKECLRERSQNTYAFGTVFLIILCQINNSGIIKKKPGFLLN
jgi:hypothetical protein